MAEERKGRVCRSVYMREGRDLAELVSAWLTVSLNFLHCNVL